MSLLFAITGLIIHALLFIGDIVGNYTDNIVLVNLPVILYLGVVSVFQTLYNRLAVWLTQQEGHLLHEEYLKSLTVKTALFQLLNYHGWFLYLAFWKRDVQYLHSQLLMFFTVKQVIGNCVETVVPKLLAYLQRFIGYWRPGAPSAPSADKSSTEKRPSTDSFSAAPVFMQHVEEQVHLSEPELFD